MIDESDEVYIDESRKNNFLSLKDKAEILERMDQGETASNLAREYGISKSTVSRFKKRKETIYKAVTTIYPNNTNRRTMRGTFHPKMEQALYKWYMEQCQQHVDVTTAMLRNQAQHFYTEFRESNYSFSASTGWIKNFKKRFGIKRLSGDKPTELNRQTTVIHRDNVGVNVSSDNVEENDDMQCESYEYLIETNATDCEDEHFPHQTSYTIKPTASDIDPVIEEKIVDDNEAYHCLETVIKWSLQRGIDKLYLTMLRNLKSKARNGKKMINGQQS